jgi:3-hydroxyisobutyrate dehydrogenase-like beta-hydroxyacid dehydrogenase
MNIAVLGMGNMGRAFAARALERGHQVTVWNRTPGRADDLVAAGAVDSRSVAAASMDADVVLVVLADDAAVLDVCLGADGVMASLGPTAVVANVSTVSPETVERLVQGGPAGRVLDSPVMGAPAVVAAGLARFLVGGDRATVESLEPLWSDLGSGYTHCGPVGAGATMKVVSNLLLITGVAALAEGIATARRSGISDEILQSILAESPVVSPASRVRLASLLDAAHPGWFTPELARKDVRLAVDLAERGGVRARLGSATEDLLTETISAGVAWPDFSAVIEALD